MMSDYTVCSYLSPEERADLDDGPDPPWQTWVAVALAALAVGMWIGRLYTPT